MTTTQEPAAVQERLDDLRRRLYRDGATAEDLRRYTEEREALLGADTRQEVPPPAAAGRSRRRLLVAATAVLVIAGSGFGVPWLLDGRPAPPAVVAVPGPGDRVQDIGGGRTLVQHAGAVSAASTQAVSVEGTAAVAQRFSGTGAAVVRVDLSNAPLAGGRTMVALSVAGSSPVTWRAMRIVSRRDWSTFPVLVEQRTVRGSPAPTVLTYARVPPSRFAVEAPDGVRWSLRIAYVGQEAPLR